MAAGASVQLLELRKLYGGVVALDTLSLDVKQGAFITLLGPSGSGKTTTLMMIAGFEEPSAGESRVANEPLTDRPPHRRNIGVVFQSSASTLLIGVAGLILGTMEALRRKAGVRVPVG